MEGTADIAQSKGYKNKNSIVYDATFITSDSGHKKHEEAREIGHNKRSKDGTFTKKNNKTYFGYKGHILTDLNPIPLIRSYCSDNCKHP
ncbi:MAG: hypothetical protein QXV17_14375 [Candidatus Micrarchaeaceae archaeon]